MFSDIIPHLIYSILNAPIREYPYPHFFSVDVFPKNFYDEILKHMPAANSYQSLHEQNLIKIPVKEIEKFERRSVITLHDDKIYLIDESIRDFWLELTKIFLSQEFMVPLLLKFQPWFVDKYGEVLELSYRADISLFRDTELWDLDPHTDQPNEILGLFFYLPSDDSTSHLGTSIYTPKKSGFTSPEGGRSLREFFDCANTLPFLPNSVLGFLRNDTSFHGVECVKKSGDVRNLIAIQIVKE